MREEVSFPASRILRGQFLMPFARSNAGAGHSAPCLRACACGIRAAGSANLMPHWNFATAKKPHSLAS